jgi:hypothetical protein
MPPGARATKMKIMLIRGCPLGYDGTFTPLIHPFGRNAVGTTYFSFYSSFFHT